MARVEKVPMYNLTALTKDELCILYHGVTLIVEQEQGSTDWSKAKILQQILKIDSERDAVR